MKILIDMNLSPDWVLVFQENGIEALHWSSIGKHNEKDSVIVEWARNSNCIIFTHDLDFGTILALTKSEKPSVVILRAADIGVDNSSEVIIRVFKKYKDLLDMGALLMYDKRKTRVRVLPLST